MAAMYLMTPKLEETSP